MLLDTQTIIHGSFCSVDLGLLRVLVFSPDCFAHRLPTAIFAMFGWWFVRYKLRDTALYKARGSCSAFWFVLSAYLYNKMRSGLNFFIVYISIDGVIPIIFVILTVKL